MRKHLLALFLSLAGLCFPQSLRAQFIGYTSPQTVRQNLVTADTCTGSQKSYTVPNLGQTVHFANVLTSGSIITFSMQFLGSNPATNTASVMSDVAVGIRSTSNNAVTATGWFPLIQVQVTCTGSGTYTIDYSGASATPQGTIGAYFLSQVVKNVVNNASAGSNSGNVSFPTPFGSSAGQLRFRYAATGPSGSSLTVQCSGGSAQNGTLFTFTGLNTTTTSQVFPVPSNGCDNVVVNYVSGGASGNTYFLDYLFDAPGTAPEGDPCINPTGLKQSTPINVTTATTTQLVAASANLQVYVCGVTITIAPSGTTADTATFEYGTGASCGTGTTALTGAFGAGDTTATVGVTPISFADPGTTMKTPPAQAFCILTAGTTVNVQGVLTYVQQ